MKLGLFCLGSAAAIVVAFILLPALEMAAYLALGNGALVLAAFGIGLIGANDPDRPSSTRARRSKTSIRR